MNNTYLKIGVLAGAAVMIGALQPAAAGVFGGGYDQDPVLSYPGLSKTTLKYVGGPLGLSIVLDEFYKQVEHDNRINTILNGGTPELRNAQKAAMAQTLLGTPTLAPSTQPGAIRELTVTQYNCIVEDMYLALDATRVPWTVQLKVIDSLGPYAPALVSAFLVAQPIGQLSGSVRVGAPSRNQ